MNFVELLGFIITMLALVILAGRRKKQERAAARQAPRKGQQTQEQIQREFLRQMGFAVPEEYELEPEPLQEEEAFIEPPPVPEVVLEPTPTPSSGKEFVSKRKPFAHLFSRRESLQEAVVVREVLGPPKALQKDVSS